MAGGLATTTTVVRADLWRMGQCRPGDTIRFKRITWDAALAVRKRTEQLISQLRNVIDGNADVSEVTPLDLSVGDEWDETILHEIPADDQKGTVQVKYRQVSVECREFSVFTDSRPCWSGWRLQYSSHIRPHDSGYHYSISYPASYFSRY